MKCIEKFSVLLAVYKEEKPQYLDSAFKSIWDDQSWKPDQIVLVCDGPLTKELDQLIAAWKRKCRSQLVLVRLSKNQGLAKALNCGLKHCDHEIIVRMDTDDICMPNRFETQVKFMIQNPGVSASSGHVIVFDEVGLENVRKVPLTYDQIKKYCKFRNPMIHPATAFRKAAVLEVGGYPIFRKGQDFALWSRLLSTNRVLKNQDSILVRMRGGDALMRRRSFGHFLGELKVLQYQYRVGVITIPQLIFNVFVRLSIRISPIALKRWVYQRI